VKFPSSSWGNSAFVTKPSFLETKQPSLSDSLLQTLDFEYRKFIYRDYPFFIIKSPFKNSQSLYQSYHDNSSQKEIFFCSFFISPYTSNIHYNYNYREHINCRCLLFQYPSFPNHCSGIYVCGYLNITNRLKYYIPTFLRFLASKRIILCNLNTHLHMILMLFQFHPLYENTASIQ